MQSEKSKATASEALSFLCFIPEEVKSIVQQTLARGSGSRFSGALVR